ADGITVGIPIGALSGDTPITVHSRSQSDMPFALPTGWDFDAALQVDFGGTQLEQGLSVALPAPAGAIPGEIRYIMQPGIVHLADGTTEQTWVMMDTLVVGEDGMLRSTSPPNQGIFNKSEINLFFVPSQVGFAAIGSPNVVGLLFAMDDFSTRSRTFQSPVKTVDEETKEEHVVQAPIVSMETVLGGQGDGPKFLVASSLLGDALIPLSSSFD